MITYQDLCNAWKKANPPENELWLKFQEIVFDFKLELINSLKLNDKYNFLKSKQGNQCVRIFPIHNTGAERNTKFIEKEDKFPLEPKIDSIGNVYLPFAIVVTLTYFGNGYADKDFCCLFDISIKDKNIVMTKGVTQVTEKEQVKSYIISSIDDNKYNFFEIVEDFKQAIMNNINSQIK